VAIAAEACIPFRTGAGPVYKAGYDNAQETETQLPKLVLFLAVLAAPLWAAADSGEGNKHSDLKSIMMSAPGR